MKFNVNRLAVSLGILCLGWTMPFCFGQTASGPDKSFAPLDQWKMAVSNHDAAALKALYSNNPPAQISAPKGDLDSDAEVAFWTGLNVRKLKIDVSQLDSPRPDLRQLILQMEIHSAASSGEQILYLSAGEVWQR